MGGTRGSYRVKGKRESGHLGVVQSLQVFYKCEWSLQGALGCLGRTGRIIGRVRCFEVSWEVF